jgi:hypothetical protein
MGEKPSADAEREPNLELPQLRLPGFRRKKVRRGQPAAESRTRPLPPAEPEPVSAVSGTVAAIVAGLVTGAAGTGATYGGLRGCQAANGVPSCGGPGLGYLIAIAIGMVALGALLLRALHAAEPVGTSFLGVGIVGVVVLLGLTGSIFSPWMFLVIPLVTAAAYAVAHWVTTRRVEPVGPPPGPDVR